MRRVLLRDALNFLASAKEPAPRDVIFLKPSEAYKWRSFEKRWHREVLEALISCGVIQSACVRWADGQAEVAYLAIDHGVLCDLVDLLGSSVSSPVVISLVTPGMNKVAAIMGFKNASKALPETVVYTKSAESGKINVRTIQAEPARAPKPMSASLMSLAAKNGFVAPPPPPSSPDPLPFEGPLYSGLFGVSNRFAGFVRSAMSGQGMLDKSSVPDVARLAAETGLSNDVLVAILSDSSYKMQDLRALARVVPGIKAYFRRRPPASSEQRQAWSKAATERFAAWREGTGFTRADQAARLGISEADVIGLEAGDFSPSWDEYEKMAATDWFNEVSLSSAVSNLRAVLKDFMKSYGWKPKRLASVLRVSLGRVEKILAGEKPTSAEFKQLRMLVPDIPNWKAPIVPIPPGPPSEPIVGSPPVHVPEPLEREKEEPIPPPAVSSPVVPPISDESEPDEISEVTESVTPSTEAPTPEPIPSPPPSTRTMAASDHPGLMDHERERILLVEDAVLRLCSPKPYKRKELFPDDTDESSSDWQRDFLRKLIQSGVVAKQGERHFTTYAGVKDRIEQFLGDPEWLLRLVAPQALFRAPFSDPNDEVVEELASEPAVASVSAESEIEGPDFVRDYYEILKFQHDRLALVEGRIQAIEKLLGAVNAKLDAVLEHLGKATSGVKAKS